MRLKCDYSAKQCNLIHHLQVIYTLTHTHTPHSVLISPESMVRATRSKPSGFYWCRCWFPVSDNQYRQWRRPPDRLTYGKTMSCRIKLEPPGRWGQTQTDCTTANDWGLNICCHVEILDSLKYIYLHLKDYMVSRLRREPLKKNNKYISNGAVVKLKLLGCKLASLHQCHTEKLLYSNCI